jgi:sialate O-acetylesterase
MINRSISLTIVFCLLLQIQAVAKITMPVTFGDGMVLQREMPLRLFGEASEGASVTVRFNGQQQTAASHNGNWMVVLEAMPAGGPYELHVSGDGEKLIFKDVMLGEVWLAGGQSNMAQALLSHIDFENYLPDEENPELRFIHIPVTEFGEIDRNGVKWNYFDRESVKMFSAVAYFFATELQKRLGVTVGIIGSYRGGTWNENWMTPESIKNEPELKYLFENYEKEYAKFKDEAAYEEAYQEYLSDLSEWKDKGGWSFGMVPFAPLGPKAYQRPSGLYNTMIKPLQPYTIKGCIWYQGEGNASRFEEFRTLFPAFVEGWRQSWLNP